MPTNLQSRARFIAGLILLLVGCWVLQGFIESLIWSVVLALATWPIYFRLSTLSLFQRNETWIALGLTLLIGAIILIPLAFGIGLLVQEIQNLNQLLSKAQHFGLPAPAWLETIPIVGEWAKKYWNNILGSAEAANASLQWFSTGSVIQHTNSLVSEFLLRFVNFVLILLVLFFIYQHGKGLGCNVLDSSRKLFGEKGYRYTVHALTALCSTVNGMLIIGLGKGLLMGPGFALAGLSNPILLGILTGFFAMIPFAAKLIFSACSIVLLADGNLVEGTGLFIYGITLTMIADNYVRPSLIGSAVKLPFIWTLLGIFGGMETLGLLGLFLGPALMAVLMSIWRDWIDTLTKIDFYDENLAD